MYGAIVLDRVPTGLSVTSFDVATNARYFLCHTSILLSRVLDVGILNLYSSPAKC